MRSILLVVSTAAWALGWAAAAQANIVEVVIDKMKIERTTEGNGADLGYLGVLGNTDDEVYLVVAGATSNGKRIADGRIGPPDLGNRGYWDGRKGATLRNLPVWEGHLEDGERVGLFVGVMDEDTGSASLGVALALGWGGSVMQDLVTSPHRDDDWTAEGRWHFWNYLDESGHDLIGGFWVDITNRGGRIDVDWGTDWPTTEGTATSWHGSKLNLTADGSDSLYRIEAHAGRPLLYRIRNLHSGKCLDVEYASRANRADVQQYTCHDDGNQKFRLRPGDFGGVYQIVADHSGKCLDVENGSHASGANVQQYYCHADVNQWWHLRWVGGYAFELVGYASGKCLDIPGWSTANGESLQQYECNRGTNQLFWLEVR